MVLICNKNELPLFLNIFVNFDFQKTYIYIYYYLWFMNEYFFFFLIYLN